MKKGLLSLEGVQAKWILGILRQAEALKRNRKTQGLLAGKTLGLLFTKPSTRTRISFEVAMNELGGHVSFLQSGDVGMGSREAVQDVARTLSRYLSGLVVRAHAHKDIELMQAYSSVPVINGLSDSFHPCQALTDLFTVWEKKKTFKDVTLAYVGDGNNVLHSLLLGASLVGLNIRVATPKGYEPESKILKLAQKYARKSGAKITVGRDPRQAVKKCDFVYTDVWTSMGQESEQKKRLKAFKGYQINSSLLKLAKPKVYVLHCLPAHRGEEITNAVIEGKRSIVFDQAENRLHVQKALLIKLLKD